MASSKEIIILGGRKMPAPSISGGLIINPDSCHRGRGKTAAGLAETGAAFSWRPFESTGHDYLDVAIFCLVRRGATPV
jgi:hypothetical protein